MDLHLTKMPENMQYIFGYSSEQSQNSSVSVMAAEPAGDLSLEIVTKLITAIKSGDSVVIHGLEVPKTGFCRIYLYKTFPHGMEISKLDSLYKKEEREETVEENLKYIANESRNWVSFLAEEPFLSMELLNTKTESAPYSYVDQVLHSIIRNVYLNFWEGELVSLSVGAPFAQSMHVNFIGNSKNASLPLFNLPTVFLPQHLATASTKTSEEMLKAATLLSRILIPSMHSTSYRTRNVFNEATFTSTMSKGPNLIPAFSITRQAEVTSFLGRDLNTKQMVAISGADSYAAVELTTVLTNMFTTGHLPKNNDNYLNNNRYNSTTDSSIFMNDLLPVTTRTSDQLNINPIDLTFLCEYKNIIKYAADSNTQLTNALVHKRENRLSPIHYLSSKKRYAVVMSADKTFFAVKKTDEFLNSNYAANISRNITSMMDRALAFQTQAILAAALNIPEDINTDPVEFSNSLFGCNLFDGLKPDKSNSSTAMTDSNKIKEIAATLLSEIDIEKFKTIGEISSPNKTLIDSYASSSYRWVSFKNPEQQYINNSKIVLNLTTGNVNFHNLIRNMGLTSSQAFTRTVENNFIWTDPTNSIATTYRNFSYDHSCFNVPVKLWFSLDQKTLDIVLALVKCKSIRDYALWHVANYDFIMSKVDLLYTNNLERNKKIHLGYYTTSTTDSVNWIKSWITCYNNFFTEIKNQTDPPVVATIATVVPSTTLTTTEEVTSNG